jgi:hypothetical protein
VNERTVSGGEAAAGGSQQAAETQTAGGSRGKEAACSSCHVQLGDAPHKDGLGVDQGAVQMSGVEAEMVTNGGQNGSRGQKRARKQELST